MKSQFRSIERRTVRLATGLVVIFAVAFGQAENDSVMAPVRVPFRSPGRAVLLSLLVPGGGQIYTHRFWKAAVIAPAELGLGYLAYQENRRASQAFRQGDTVKYRYYQDRRNTWLWWTAATVVFSMADAYVSAQMFGFDQELQIDLQPDRLGVRLALR
ncbi:MAG: DUF5683 domain-containing protein [candidate division WOR-3 bacterium]|jgi:hypothetical protein